MRHIIDVMTNFNSGHLKSIKNLDFYDSAYLLISILFLVVAYLISVVNHELFLSSAMDMGIYNQLVYKFSHFKYPVSTVYPSRPDGIFFLGDHMSLILPIESMFYWILGKNVLLYLQIFYLLLGNLGLYKLIKLLYSKPVALLASILFYTHYSVYNVLSFDYHTNVLGMMLIPWIVYFYYRSNFFWFTTLIFLGIFTKEDSALYYILTGIVIFIPEYKSNKLSLKKYSQMKYFIVLIGASAIYFLISYKFILPYFNPIPDKTKVISNWKIVPEMGKSIGELFFNIISNPGKTIQLMSNTIEKQVKINTFLYTGGLLIPFVGWFYLLPLVPLFIMTLLSTEWSMWGNLGHYNIILSIWLPIIIAAFINKLKYNSIKIFVALFFLYEYFTILKTTPIEPSKWTRTNRVFYSEYYAQRFNINAIKQAIKIIPDNASVSASTHILPHLAFRDKIYYFPTIADADYIILIENDCNDRFYPFPNTTECYKIINEYKNNNRYSIVYNTNSVLVLRKK